MKTLWYYLFKAFIKTALFFYTKQIKVVGKENIPKKGAILFTSNHPNALIDPLIIATHNPRIQHFLVRAAVFKNPYIKRFLATLNLMPIYRIRDGKSELSKNQAIFNQCFEILKNEKSLLIFPEGSHNRKRTIRPISKGFTRIVFGTLDKYPETKITIIPVGLTYQNASVFPSKVALHYGKPIVANNFYNAEEINTSIKQLKEQVSSQLMELTVHIDDTENYTESIAKLNTAQVDFTDVETVNWITKKKTFPPIKKAKAELTLLKFIILLNSIIPYFIWKKSSKKIIDIEFVDTFRFGIGTVLVPLFYLLQSLVLYYFFGRKIAAIYFVISIVLVLFYTKLSPTNTEKS